MKVLAMTLLLLTLSCTGVKDFTTVEPEDHPWLRGKKIFIDPGHGRSRVKDLFRTGPNGITEEEINLKVSLFLRQMLRRAGARVAMSRETRGDVPLDRRVEMIRAHEPELLVSVHHNGSPRREDPVNYPCVLFWGTKEARPASYDFAQLLLAEFHKIMDEKGVIVSDFSVFHETGTRILRETSDVCPGVIGEGGFFSDCDHAVRLSDPQYNEREAEAYFTALSRYFKRGIPEARVAFSCAVDNTGYMKNMLRDTDPDIFIHIDSDNEAKGIYEKTFHITLDGIPVGFDKIRGNIFSVRYGERLYPGSHRLRFSFRNLRYQSSMVYSVPFYVEVNKGDYRSLVTRGKKLVTRKGTSREGLKMLIAALSMGKTDPAADELIWYIARGFRMTGDRSTADY